jgi:hypothetical protein
LLIEDRRQLVAVIPEIGARGGHIGGRPRLRVLSERRRGKQRDQRESSDKRLHHTTPCYGRSSVGPATAGKADGRRFAVTQDIRTSTSCDNLYFGLLTREPIRDAGSAIMANEGICLQEPSLLKTLKR